MKKTLAKIIQISDIVQWNEKKEIELSPKYQRNKVWNDKAKSYLIDTIIKGLPIPPVFLRQRTDIKTKSTNREIIDGQQRIRTILEFIIDESFTIKTTHNKQYGGLYYSQLDEDTQEALLEYEILAEVVIEKDETMIYDMFARLNSNNYVLNPQEIRNSKYWGDFKVLAYSLSSEYREFFLKYGMVSPKECTRMKDTELINSMIILLLDGIVAETPTSIDKTYEKYDKEFKEARNIEEKFVKVMTYIQLTYEYHNGNLSVFTNKNFFFTFYCVLVNQLFGISPMMERSDLFAIENIDDNLTILYNKFGQFVNDYDNSIDDSSNTTGLYLEFQDFLKSHKTRTTNKDVRLKRIKFMNKEIAHTNDDL